MYIMYIQSQLLYFCPKTLKIPGCSRLGYVGQSIKIEAIPILAPLHAHAHTAFLSKQAQLFIIITKSLIQYTFKML